MIHRHTPSSRFAGFRPEDRKILENPPAPKPIVGKTPSPNEKPRPIQVNTTDKALIQALEREASRDSAGMPLWGLEWKLKARIMQLNDWASGKHPWPGKNPVTQYLHQQRIQHQARQLFKSIGQSKTYTPSPWLMGHLAWLARHFRIGVASYFSA